MQSELPSSDNPLEMGARAEPPPQGYSPVTAAGKWACLGRVNGALAGIPYLEAVASGIDASLRRMVWSRFLLAGPHLNLQHVQVDVRRACLGTARECQTTYDVVKERADGFDLDFVIYSPDEMFVTCSVEIRKPEPPKKLIWR